MEMLLKMLNRFKARSLVLFAVCAVVCSSFAAAQLLTGSDDNARLCPITGDTVAGSELSRQDVPIDDTVIIMSNQLTQQIIAKNDNSRGGNSLRKISAAFQQLMLALFAETDDGGDFPPESPELFCFLDVLHGALPVRAGPCC